MSMLVTMDFGNSRAKAALFLINHEGASLKEEFDASNLESVLKKYQLNVTDVPAVLCEVKKYPQIINSLLEKGMLIENISDSWRGNFFDGMKVNYAHSIGLDRLIGTHYAYKHFKKRAMVIDAGTFLTLDVVTNEGFLGGYIFPGLSRLHNTFSEGENLFIPSISSSLSLDQLPYTTEEALSGYMVSLKLIIKKWMDHYKLELLIITGGESSSIKKIIEDFSKDIEIHEHSHYLHWALMNWWKGQGHI